MTENELRLIAAAELAPEAHAAANGNALARSVMPGLSTTGDARSVNGGGPFAVPDGGTLPCHEEGVTRLVYV